MTAPSSHPSRLLRISLHQAFLYLESPPASARQDVAAVSQVARETVQRSCRGVDLQ